MSAPEAWMGLLPRPEATQNMASVADMMRARNLAPLQQKLLQQQTQEGQARTGLIGQQTQGAELENQQRQQSLTDANLFMQGMKQKGDPQAALDWAKDNGMSGAGYLSHINTVQQMVKNATDLEKDKLALHQQNYEAGWDTAKNFQDLPPEKQTPEAYQSLLANLEKYEPGISSEVQNKPQGEALDSIVSHFGTGKWVAERALAEQKNQEEAWKEIPGTGMMVNVLSGARIGAGLGNIDSLNSELTARWQVLHPGEALPKEFNLPKDASPLDYQRIDKNLQAMEQAEGTQQQRNLANSIREQTLALAQQKRDTDPVIGEDANGNHILVGADKAKDMGLDNTVKAGQQDVTKAMAARKFLKLGDTIKQDIAALDKAGKLGPIQTRWNNFLDGTLGAGDPLFEKLRVDMGLSTTLLMNYHVGAKGSSELMEHFESLANAKAMNAKTMYAGIDAELDYAKSAAMEPQGSPPKSNAKPALQIGQMVSIKGKQMKVTAVHPDGSFDAK